MSGMKDSHIEPGLLQVFRWYAILRTVLIFIAPLREIVEVGGRFGEYVFVRVYPDIFFVTLEMTVLVAYLHLPWLQKKLGQAYLPIALILALAGPIFEQLIFSPLSAIWQPTPFLIVPILLAAWQYNFSVVTIFILAAAAVEIGLENSIYHPQIFYRVPFPASPFTEINSIILYGRVISRTTSSLILGFIVTRLMNSQRKQRQELAEANRKLVQHAATLEQLTVSRERIRLSRELHDTLAHTLSALTVQLEAVIAVWKRIPKKAVIMLDQMLTSTRDGLNDTRRALQALRAAPLEELGLATAINNMAEEISSRNKLELDTDISDTIAGLPPEVEQCYYRVAQEALQNATQHANATHLNVILRQTGILVALTVADDGSGFDLEDIGAKEHFGITGMRERAELVDAAFTIVSSPAGGTTVQLAYQVESK